MPAVEGSKPLFLEMGTTVSKQTNAHLLGFQTLRGNTFKNEFSVLHLRHLSGPILQSLLLSAQDRHLPSSPETLFFQTVTTLAARVPLL